MKKTSLRTASAMLLAAAAGFGQTAPAGSTFEVASIRPALPFTPERLASGQIHFGIRIDKALADFGQVSLVDLIATAYRVRSFQVSGPDWISVRRFDILAKLPQGASADSLPEMLQALLSDRFKLRLHRDSKEFSIYALVVGKGGSKLVPKPADYDSTVKNNLQPMTMDDYAERFSLAVDRPVVNQTELKGEYMVSMTAINRARQRHALAMAGWRPNDAVPDLWDSDIFGAVQTLGLKLEPQKLPLTLLVIEQLEKSPTEN